MSDSSRRPQQKRGRVLAPLLIFGLALSLRLVFLSGLEAYPKFELIKNRLDDQVVFDLWAKSILGGRALDFSGTGHEFAHWMPRCRGVFPQAPLYPHFLAGLYGLLGFRYDLIRAVQMLLGAGAASLIYLLGRRFLRPWAAVLCGVTAALYGPFVFYEATFLRAALSTFVSTLCLWLLASAAAPTARAASRQRLLCLATGVALAAGVLLRPNFLLFSLAAIAWLFFEQKQKSDEALPLERRAGARIASLVSLGLLVPLLPVILLNSARSGQPSFVSCNGPYNFFIGNVHDARGDGPQTTPHYLAVKASGPPQKVDLLAEALRDIRQHPGDFARLQIRKLGFFFSPRELPNNLSYDMAKMTNPRLSVAFVELHQLLPIAVLGIALSLRQFRRFGLLHLFVGCSVAATVAFFVLARLRLLIVPALIIFAALAVQWWWQELERRRFRNALVAFLLAACATLLLKPNPATVVRRTDYQMAAAAHFSLAEELEEDGRPDEARQHYTRAVLLNPDHERAIARLHTLDGGAAAAESSPARKQAAALCEEARAAAEKQQYDEAQRLLELAQLADPSFATPHHYLSNIHVLLRDRRRALEHMEKALELEPTSPLFRRNLKALRYQAAEAPPRSQ